MQAWVSPAVHSWMVCTNYSRVFTSMSFTMKCYLFVRKYETMNWKRKYETGFILLNIWNEQCPNFKTLCREVNWNTTGYAVMEIPCKGYMVCEEIWTSDWERKYETGIVLLDSNVKREERHENDVREKKWKGESFQFEWELSLCFYSIKEMEMQSCPFIFS